jgi:hypothetical protein
VSASAVGQILGFQQNDIQKIVDEFALKESELQQSLDNLDENAGGVQHKLRAINMLKKQLEHKEVSLEEKRAEIKRVNGVLMEMSHRFDEAGFSAICFLSLLRLIFGFTQSSDLFHQLPIMVKNILFIY